MKTAQMTVRILTLACYFFPFIFFMSTCDGSLSEKIAFNQKEAILNERGEISHHLSEIESLLDKQTSSNFQDVSLEARELVKHYYGSSDRLEYLELNWQNRLLMPTDYSLSAVGILLLSKKILLQVGISLSLLFSLIQLFLYRIIKKRKLIFTTIVVNLLLVTTLLVYCLVMNITLQYGAWILLLLILSQLISESENQSCSSNQNSNL